VLSGAHMTLFARTIELLKEGLGDEADEVVVFGGGIIPDEDMPQLKAMGVGMVFTPGATMEQIVRWVRDNVGSARTADA